MSAEIKIACSDCGKTIKVKLHIVDKLQAEIADLRAENGRLRQRLNNSSINANKNADMGWFFDALNKGGRE